MQYEGLERKLVAYRVLFLGEIYNINVYSIWRIVKMSNVTEGGVNIRKETISMKEKGQKKK